MNRPARQYTVDPSPQEHAVLRCLWDGMQQKEIAMALGISTKTVKNYTLTLYQKFQVHTNVQAVRKGLELGLLELSVKKKGDEWP